MPAAPRVQSSSDPPPGQISVMEAPVWLLLLVLPCHQVTGSQVRNVYWNTTTASANIQPLVVTVNENNLPWEYDQVNLICPVVGEAGEEEQHVIYSVEKEEFESCRVSSPRPRIVAVCNRPRTFMYFTITFRSFTPTPGALEFSPGKEYYFISTSTNKDIHRRAGGWCRSHNMKMIFKVAESEASQNAILDMTTRKPKPIPTPAAFWSRYWNAKVPSEEETYSHETVNYQQTREDTYFGQRDETVDIRIVSRANTSTTSQASLCLLLLSLVALFTSSS